MTRLFTLVGGVLVLSVLITGCGPTTKTPQKVTRMISIEGYAPEEFEMTVEEAAMVDQMIAGEPETGAADKCDYWKKQFAQIPPSKRGAFNYARKAGGGWCAVAK